MRKIIAITNLSLDGIMQSPGGPEEDPRRQFAHGGWVMPFFDRSVDEALAEVMAVDFDLLLGRRTYEIFAGYWPYAGDNPVASAFNRATKYVATRTLRRLEWAKSQALTDAVAELRRLKANDGPALHVWGSGELLQQLFAHDLVDEIRVWLYPVILGQGQRLFEAGLPARALKLVDSRRTPHGILLNTYQPTGPLPLPAPDPEKPTAAELERRKKIVRE